jgi:shikimate dehydrogenase
MHQAAYDALDLPWVYAPFSCDSTSLADALRGMRALGIRGLGISMPFKIEILPLLDALSPLARDIGAVNTVVHEPEGRLVGHNTDAEGAVAALEEMVDDLREREVLVLGAGGAARAVAFGLHRTGARLVLANRSEDKARELARELTGARAISFSEACERPPCPIVVQASSGGMHGEGDPPIDAAAFTRESVVMDIVYDPIETKLIRAARATGATVAHGGRMLLHQAARQFALYVGRPAPLEVMAGAMDTIIQGRR